MNRIISILLLASSHIFASPPSNIDEKSEDWRKVLSFKKGKAASTRTRALIYRNSLSLKKRPASFTSVFMSKKSLSSEKKHPESVPVINVQKFPLFAKSSLPQLAHDDPLCSPVSSADLPVKRNLIEDFYLYNWVPDAEIKSKTITPVKTPEVSQAAGVIVSIINGKHFYGVGTLIQTAYSDKYAYVLTAAQHLNLASDKKNIYLPQHVYFYPGYTTKGKYTPKYEVINAAIPKAWVEHKSQAHNYCVLRLSQSIPNIKPFQLKLPTDFSSTEIRKLY